MKVTLESTSKVIEFIPRGGGKPVECRIWEGKTDTGIPVHAYLVRIAVSKSEDCSQFERELRECIPPTSDIQAIPLRMIL